MLSIDRLSALPDFVLIHILSLLQTKQAAVTALLSKRWRYLWTESPTLIFRERIWNDIQGTRMFVARVHGTLVNCRRNNLDRFEVNFKYRNCFERDVNVWIEFAVKNKVKNVYMLLGFSGDYHLLPQIIYSNSSLTTLRMQSCIMDRRRTIEWKSLAELHLERVELPQDVLDEILSGCYVLRNLHLSECWGFNSLMVNSRSLCKLEVRDCDYDEKEEDEDEDEPLEISAPYILSLDIRMYAATTRMQRKLRVTNIPSLVTSSITIYDDIVLNPEVLMSIMNQFLESIKHVNELELGCESIMVLSCLIRDGQRLPQSSRRCLKLHAYSHKFSVYGIVGLLDSSPNLETLVIEIHDPSLCGRYCFEAPCDDLAGDLLHLKDVTVTNLSHSDPSYEPLIILPQILLKRAVALEKMVIYHLDILPPSRVGTSDSFKLAQTLLSYPRSSQKAVVFLHQRHVTESTRFHYQRADSKLATVV